MPKQPKRTRSPSKVTADLKMSADTPQSMEDAEDELLMIQNWIISKHRAGCRFRAAGNEPDAFSAVGRASCEPQRGPWTAKPKGRAVAVPARRRRPVGRLL